MNEVDPPQNGYGNEAPASNGKGIKDYVRWFLRRFWIFLITCLGGYFLGLYVASLTPVTYQSQATIEIERVKKEDADVDEEERIRMGGASEMFSVTEKLRLPNLYTNIAASPKFAEREDVAPEKFHMPWEDVPSVSGADMSPEALGGMMRGWVTVRWRKDTTLIDLYASHSDPEIARDTLEGLIEEYDRSVESKVAGSSEFALDYILESSDKVKEKMLNLERALRLYKRCLELSDEIRGSETAIAQMEKRYLPKWPALVEAKELGAILKKNFSKELDQVIRLSDEEKAFWEQHSESFSSMDADTRIDSQIQIASTRASVLERELEAEQQIYDNLITKLKEGNVSKGFDSKQFDVVQPPSLPSNPTGPNKKKITMKYLFGGAALGVGIILLLGFLDPTVRTVADLEVLTGTPVIGAMPASKNTERKGSLALDAEDEQSQSAEAIRTLRAGLTFLGTSEERRTFLITSAVPGEGKSWVASNLALSFASQGDRTLLIDGDLRKPVQSQVFEYDKEHPGLSDHLSLNRPLKEVVMKTRESENLFIMPAGSRSANPSELLAGKGLKGAIGALEEYFDRIIIDSAPLVPVSDSLPLAKLAESVVLVCRVGKTPRGAIKRAIRVLEANHSAPVGVVANGLPRTRTKGAYGYYYSYYGGGNYANYSDAK